MMQDLYPWLVSTWDSWKQQLDSERVPRSILLLSPNGLGVEQLLDRLAAALMCVNYESEACGFCHSCELMKSGSHPDLHRITPEKEGKAITVDQIRASNRWAQESSHLDGYRLIIIDPAEGMNEAASNALLKTLEEPAEKCIFVLVSPNNSRLMPTIVSRCQQWKVSQPDTNTAQTWLEGKAGKLVPSFLLSLNDGLPVHTLAMIEDGSVEQAQKVFEGYVEVISSPGSDLFGYVSTLNKDPSKFLGWLWHLLIDTQKRAFAVTGDELIPESLELSKVITYQQAFQRTQSLQALLEQLRLHPGLNSELLIMNWLIQAKEEPCL